MKAVYILSLLFLGACALPEHVIKTRILSAEESELLDRKLETEGLPKYDASNEGDLIYSARRPNDVLLARDVVINEGSTRQVQDITWSINTSSDITSVRVLNFGRQIGYGLNINVRGGDATVTIRFPVVNPRIMIEVYGFH